MFFPRHGMAALDLNVPYQSIEERDLLLPDLNIRFKRCHQFCFVGSHDSHNSSKEIRCYHK